jgi:DNA polymerase elongation subunit (family B)
MQVNRTSELARVFGIDFFSVLSRGSQYRVESMLLRLAHTQNYLAISPGNQQVHFCATCQFLVVHIFLLQNIL